MIAMKVKWKKLGGHIHCRVFTAPHVSHTYAKNGELVFSEAEWNDVLLSFECGGIEVVKEAQ